MNKNNILFLNFDKFNNDKVSFFNNVEKIIKKKIIPFFFFLPSKLIMQNLNQKYLILKV
jgi:hypothetical protein